MVTLVSAEAEKGAELLPAPPFERYACERAQGQGHKNATVAVKQALRVDDVRC